MEQTIALPKDWPRYTRSAVVHVIGLAQYVIAYTRGWAANNPNERIRWKARAERAEASQAQDREIERIKDTRMAKIPPHKRPHYDAEDRLAILAVRAAKAWTKTKTAEVFLVTEDTIASWTKRVDEEGPDALIQLREPVNKFPELVALMVKTLRTLFPFLGYRKIAEWLCRGALHLSASTVRRMVKEEKKARPTKQTSPQAGRKIKANYSNHVHNADLTCVSILDGLWAPWPPDALPQCWPFCWWVAAAIDRYSRRVVGFEVFRSEPSCEQVCDFLGRTFRTGKCKPKHVITDRGPQFDCDEFRTWCRRRRIKFRYGAVQKHGSLAIIERWFRTFKEVIRQWPSVPYGEGEFRQEVRHVVDWYNEFRPAPVATWPYAQRGV